MATFHNFQSGKTLIGLSLSLCVAEMVRNNISDKDIIKIVANTNAPDKKTFEEVLKEYTKVYWVEFPRKAKALARRLYKGGKIEQPRTEGKPTHTIVNGKWVESEADIEVW